MTIGAISCRIWPREVIKRIEHEGTDKEEHYEDPKDARRSLYIIILSVLPNYRRFGIASQLLEEAIRKARQQHPELYSVYLHTPVDNETAINFYLKNGFEKKEVEEKYYKSMGEGSEKDGVVLERLFE